jgi:hypothetical protein
MTPCVKRKLVTIKTRLEGSMFPSAAFTIIFVNNQGPRLPTFLEALRHTWNCIGFPFKTVVKCAVDIAVFIIDSLLCVCFGKRPLEESYAP